MKTLASIIMLTLCSVSAFPQNNNLYEGAKNYASQIGFFDGRKFVEEGSGLVCYLIYKGKPKFCLVTAKHIIDTFLSWHKTPYIRPSWADSIKTTEWLGIKTPLVRNGVNMYFLADDPDLDIACVILGDMDRVAGNFYVNNRANIFPFNSIANPSLGDNVIIVGYPLHVENYFNQYDFSVCTVKPGMVSWIAKYQINSIVDKVLLVDCNATFGNSGGAVFSTPLLGGEIALVGVQSQIIWDVPILVNTTGALSDSLKKIPYAQPRSGVAIVVKAQLVKDFLYKTNEMINSDVRYSFLADLFPTRDKP